MSKHTDSLARITSEESLIPFADVKFRITNMLSKWMHVEEYALAALGENWRKLLNQEWVSAPAREGLAFKTFFPMGVFLNITPATDNIGVTLSTVLDLFLGGNPILLKPASIANRSVLFMLEHFPPLLRSYIDVAVGDAKKVIDIAVENESLYGIMYTGTSKAGQQIAAVCGAKHVRFIGEYEGNNITLVLNDFDPIKATNIVGHSVRGYNGLACACSHLVGVQERRYDLLKRHLITFANVVNRSPHHPALPETLLGPQLTEGLAIGCEQIIEKSLQAGAKLLTGGRRTGNFIEFTILEGFPTTIAHEFEGAHCGHIYGPLLFIDTFDRVLSWSIRATQGRRGYALRNSILSYNMEAIRQLSTRLPSAIDTTNIFHFDSLAPWHGMKRSSTSAGAVHMITEVVNTKYLFDAPKDAKLSADVVVSPTQKTEEPCEDDVRVTLK